VGILVKPKWPTKQDLTDEPTLKSVSDVVFRHAREASVMLSNGLTIADNMNATISSVDCSHDVETLMPRSGFRGLPSFFQPLYTTVSRTDTTPSYPVLGTPIPLNYDTEEGYIGLRVRFDSSGPYAEFSSSGTQSINNATLTVVSHQTIDIVDSSGVLSIASNGSGPASSRITASEAGIYEIVGQAGFASNATGYRQAALQANAAGNFKGLILTPTVNGDIWSANYSTRWSLAANDYVQVTLWQNSGGALNTVSGATSTGVRTQVRRVGFIPGSVSATVTGIFWGG